MQLSLQLGKVPIRHRQAISEGAEVIQRLHVRVFAWFRPMGNLKYEHMFSSAHRSQRLGPVARRLGSAAVAIRSFLLLEDDYVCDWEVDWSEREEFGGDDTNGQASVALRSELGGSEGQGHPHRVVLQSRLGDRRAGEVVGSELVCVCPVASREHRGSEVGQRGSRMSTGIVRVAIDR
jgi:hypothetical protein